MAPPRRRSFSLTPEESSLIQKYFPELKPPSKTISEESESTEPKTINETLNQIFDEPAGRYSMSSSRCENPSISQKSTTVEQDCDKRLKCWYKMLEERKNIVKRIQEATGKKAHNVLMERHSIDIEEKNMIKRVLDYSDRLNPVNLSSRKLLRIPDHKNPKPCTQSAYLDETLPRSEREQRADFEIVGIPALTREELFGSTHQPYRNTDWICSKALVDTIEKKTSDIVRVLEFYPEIEHLAVVGKSLMKKPNDNVVQPVSEPQLTVEENNELGSSSLQMQQKLSVGENDIPPVRIPAYGLKINEFCFVGGSQGECPCINIETKFQCCPFESVTKSVLHLENFGQNIIDISLVEAEYENDFQLSYDNEFFLDSEPFRLLPGKQHDINVKFLPRQIGTVREKWILRVDPQFFVQTSGDIILKFCGRCGPTDEYLQSISNLLNNIKQSCPRTLLNES